MSSAVKANRASVKVLFRDREHEETSGQPNGYVFRGMASPIPCIGTQNRETERTGLIGLGLPADP